MAPLAAGVRSGSPSNDVPQLFEGKQFWLSHNIPQRNRFKELIEKHGGTIKLLEKDADIMLVDHARKNLPDNTYSYQYIERSVRNGKLEPLEAYRTGPSPHRPVGATNIPTRGRRFQYTLEDDQILWDWMQPYERERSAPIFGYSIYQELAEKFPQHTFQSYRDRWRKKLRGHPRPGGGVPRDFRRSTASDVPSERTSPAHAGPASNTNQQPHTNTDTSPTLPEARKRKRPIHDESTRNTHPSHDPETPSRKTRVVDTTSASRSRQHHREQPERHHLQQKQPDSTNQRPSEPPNPETTVDPLFLELPFPPSDPESGDDEGPEPDIDAWIDDRLRYGKAQSPAQVIEALRCASMDTYLADKVLGSLAAGKGIPSDMPGVWTAEDDRCIEGKDARSIERVLKKHGGKFFNARWDYLDMFRAGGFE